MNELLSSLWDDPAWGCLEVTGLVDCSAAASEGEVGRLLGWAGVRCLGQPGIYVEIRIRAPLERVWALTQEPAVHQRWDLRFSEIQYLPRAEGEPQRFLYATRIGFGLAIRGTGESVATRRGAGGEATSSLKFGSEDPKSLIREGAGYWRYVPLLAEETRFLTWYDYRVRFGLVGRWLNAALARPLMGWATAWSFDRLRKWAEEGQRPEASLTFATVQAVARVGLAAVWLWHGLVPKLIFRDADEVRMLMESGLAVGWLPWVGAAEVVLGLLTLLLWRRWVFLANGALMMLALLAVLVRSPEYVTRAFNPVTLNLLMAAMAVVGWLVFPYVPSAARCLRTDPRRAETDPRRAETDPRRVEEA